MIGFVMVDMSERAGAFRQVMELPIPLWMFLLAMLLGGTLSGIYFGFAVRRAVNKVHVRYQLKLAGLERYARK